MLWKRAKIKKVDYTFPAGLATIITSKEKVGIESNCHGLGTFINLSPTGDIAGLIGKEFYYVTDKFNIMQFFQSKDEWEGPRIKLNGEKEWDPPTPIDELLDSMPEINEKALYPTDLKEAIIGTVERFGMEPQILVDKNKCIEILVQRDGMTEEEAREYFEFNVIGAWMGDGTPCFANLI